MLGLQHRPEFNPSCMALDGAAIAFLGHSGRSKSTLATYLGLPVHMAWFRHSFMLDVQDQGTDGVAL